MNLGAYPQDYVPQYEDYAFCQKIARQTTTKSFADSMGDYTGAFAAPAPTTAAPNDLPHWHPDYAKPNVPKQQLGDPCGGALWTGPTDCESPSTCKKLSDNLSECTVEAPCVSEPQLEACKAKIKWSKYQNGCIGFARGFTAGDKTCDRCGSLSRSYSSCSMAECLAMCSELYAGSSNIALCSQGCDYYQQFVQATTQAEQVELAEHADQAEQLGQAKHADQAEQAEQVEQAEHADQAEQAKHADQAEQLEQLDQAEQALTWLPRLS